MYKNLKAELVRNGIKVSDAAKRLELKAGTLSLKINGKARVTLDEAFMLQKLIFEKSNEIIPIETLFKA